MVIWLKLKPSTLLSTLNPFSLVELSFHDNLMSKHPTALARRLDGAWGVGSSIALGVGVAIGLDVTPGVS
jgi:hypothetical protein